MFLSRLALTANDGAGREHEAKCNMEVFLGKCDNGDVVVSDTLGRRWTPYQLVRVPRLWSDSHVHKPPLRHCCCNCGQTMDKTRPEPVLDLARERRCFFLEM